MKKILLFLSIILLFSSHVFSNDISFSNPKNILPNEDVQSFELADLNGNGKQEIVYLTSNGELKYATLGHYINESSRDLLTSTDWDIVDHTDVTLRFTDSIYSILKRGSGQGTTLVLKDGTFVGNYNNWQYLLIDYISETEISGEFMDHKLGIYSKTPFKAVPM